MGEILSQDVEFITTFMELLAMTPGSHPRTFRVLHIASLIGSFAALHFKHEFNRPRPSWQCPALLPPVPVPGHSSYPSGHATQAHLIALCMQHVLELVTPPLPQRDTNGLKESLQVLARRVARNREIAGLHFESDSAAGKRLAEAAFGVLTQPDPQLSTEYAIRPFGSAVIAAARREWTPERPWP